MASLSGWKDLVIYLYYINSTRGYANFFSDIGVYDSPKQLFAVSCTKMLAERWQKCLNIRRRYNPLLIFCCFYESSDFKTFFFCLKWSAVIQYHPKWLFNLVSVLRINSQKYVFPWQKIGCYNLGHK